MSALISVASASSGELSGLHELSEVTNSFQEASIVANRGI